MSQEATKAGPPRPEDKGVSAGLTTLPLKKISYKSINDNKPKHSPGQGRISISKIYDAVQWKPKGSCKADSPSDTQDNSESTHMEHQDDAGDRKNHPSSKRDEKLQDRSAGTEWDKVATIRTTETFICTQDTSRMEPPILRVWPWCWHQRHRQHSSAGNLSTPASSQ